MTACSINLPRLDTLISRPNKPGLNFSPKGGQTKRTAENKDHLELLGRKVLEGRPPKHDAVMPDSSSS